MNENTLRKLNHDAESCYETGGRKYRRENRREEDPRYFCALIWNDGLPQKLNCPHQLGMLTIKDDKGRVLAVRYRCNSDGNQPKQKTLPTIGCGSQSDYRNVAGD
jgi:hypothetical protein